MPFNNNIYDYDNEFPEKNPNTRKPRKKKDKDHEVVRDEKEKRREKYKRKKRYKNWDEYRDDRNDWYDPRREV